MATANRLRGSMALLRICRTLNTFKATASSRCPHQLSAPQIGAILYSRKFAMESSRMYSDSAYNNLKARGFIENVSGGQSVFEQEVAKEKVGVYAGVDPTAPSPHLGNLVALMPLLHFWLHGHKTILLIGEATASVGDPSGRDTERQLDAVAVRTNKVTSLTEVLQNWFNRAAEYAISRGYDKGNVGELKVMNNKDWLGKISAQEFFQLVGPRVRVGQMLARDSVKSRMNSGDGISYGEFSYQLLQSFDFWHLYSTENCRLQVGGGDQWGNITAGIDLINRMNSTDSSMEVEGAEVENGPLGLTVPLLVTSSGEKYGKSAGNAIWLKEDMTSPLELYQYLVQSADEDVERYLKLFTLLPLVDIKTVVSEHAKEPEKREAQRVLATEIVTMIHGDEQADISAKKSLLLFGSPSSSEDVSFTAADLKRYFQNEPQYFKQLKRSDVVGNAVSKVARLSDATASRSAAHQIIKGGGFYVGLEGRKVTDPNMMVENEMLIDDSVLVIRLGKSKVKIIALED